MSSWTDEQGQVMNGMLLILLLNLALWPERTNAAGDVSTGFYSNKAIRGYDVVSFFNGEPKVGTWQYRVNYRGAVWLFSSKQNHERFMIDPVRYVPQYGGYCAYSISEVNILKPADPELWHIIDNKLYFNHNSFYFEEWKRRSNQYIAQGDKNWFRR